MLGNIFIIWACIAVSVSALVASKPVASSIIPIELEFGKVYTIESLLALRESHLAHQTTKNARTDAAHEQANAERKAGLVTRALVVATEILSIHTTWVCPQLGTISRDMRLSIKARTNSDRSGRRYGTVYFMGLLNAEKLTRASQYLEIPRVAPGYKPFATHEFCLYLGNVICAYQWTQQFSGTLQGSGRTNPTDGPVATFRETCVVVTGSTTTCPATLTDRFCRLTSESHSVSVS